MMAPPVLIVGLVSFLLASAAENKPNFSGLWKLNAAKSDFGKSPAPESMTTRIEHHNPEFKVHSETTGPWGTYATDYAWVLDGRENVNTIRGKEVHATVVWNGKTLASNATTFVQGEKLTILDLWSLSEDGHTLMISRTIHGPKGTSEQKYVYEK